MNYSWRAFRVQKLGSERESSTNAGEVVPSTPPVSASKANWLDDESDEDMDLETLGKALSEAGILASRSKKPHGNCQSETVIRTSPSVPRTWPVDMETPGEVVLQKKILTYHLILCCVAE